MSQQIFINLPVRDLPKAMAFYTALGSVKNPQFTDASAACMVLSEHIFVMLLTHEKWATFTQKPIASSARSEVMLALACSDRAAVDRMLQAAAAQGGKADVQPPRDLGFMYNRCFEDLDGHIWEAFYMDMTQVPQTPQAPEKP